MAHFYKELNWQAYYLTTLAFASLVFAIALGADLNNAGNVSGAVSLQGAALIFLFFLVVGLLAELTNIAGFSKRIKIFHGMGEYSAFYSGVGFIVGFLLFLYVTGGVNSVIGFDVTKTSVYSGIASSVSQFWSTFLVTVAAPITEEYGFFIGTPIVIYALLGLFARQTKLKFLDNFLVQTIIMVLFTSAFFAWFHRSMDSSFFFMAMVFRAIIVFVGAYDNKIPWLSTTFLFAVGAHMANNINSTVGFSKWVEIMSSDVIGWFVLVFFVVNGVFVLSQLGNWRSLSRA